MNRVERKIGKAEKLIAQASVLLQEVRTQQPTPASLKSSSAAPPLDLRQRLALADTIVTEEQAVGRWDSLPQPSALYAHVQYRYCQAVLDYESLDNRKSKEGQLTWNRAFNTYRQWLFFSILLPRNYTIIDRAMVNVLYRNYEVEAIELAGLLKLGKTIPLSGEIVTQVRNSFLHREFNDIANDLSDPD